MAANVVFQISIQHLCGSSSNRSNRTRDARSDSHAIDKVSAGVDRVYEGGVGVDRPRDEASEVLASLRTALKYF